MDLPQDNSEHIKLVAEDTLTQFEKVSSAAQNALHNGHALGSDSLASVNTLTGTSAINRLGQIDQSNRESFQILAREPAIARVVVADCDGNQRTYYICRTTPIKGFPNFASYRAPVGRLASMDIGDEFLLPKGVKVEVLERSHLFPSQIDEGWDSRNTVIESEYFGPITIESLRALLNIASVFDIDSDLIEKLLAEEAHAANIIEGKRRSVITKMGLRDQPILDRYQDEIFRLSLDKRLLILGPPGTGKTTTLIRRLGQKLDFTYLDEDEQSIVGNANESEHAESWLMFTPTELLKQYLKEAFAREGVPASDLRIRTWSDCRRELARNVFSVLKTATGAGTFVLKDSVETMEADAFNDPIGWFSDFNDWQSSTFVKEMQQAAHRLSENTKRSIAEVGERLLSAIERTSGKSLISMFSSIASEVENVQSLLGSMKEVTDGKIKSALNLQLKRDGKFVDKLVTFLDGLQQVPDNESDEFDDQEGEEDEQNVPRTGRSAAINAYSQALKSQAKASASKRALGKKSRNAKIIEWLGEQTLGETERVEIGASLLVQASLRRFVNPVKRYISGIPKRYKAFRQFRQEEDKWYCKEGFLQSDLHPLEVDVVLLAILRDASDILSKPAIVRDVDSQYWSSLKPILDLYKNQILVDEATDFSPLQIACMASLSHPRIRSFFACGDFNQRLTTWGSRSIDEMKWVFPDLDTKEITVSYRHSRQLNELARSLILATGGTDQGVTLPEHVNNEGVAPVLLEGLSDINGVACWLAQRILEIERFVGQLPSIAIFVESETEVQPVTDALNDNLAEDNVKVVACPNGQVVGQDNDVRVFAVQHIKGLEFEAVFFIGVDRLAMQHPQLFDKYLYVGTTRAATYLGITCDETLPAAISCLRPMFISDWKSV